MVISSVLTTTARVFRLFWSSSDARSIERSDAEQPWPLRLNARRSERILKWFAAMAHSEGVGEKSEQLITRKSTSLGRIPVRLNRSAMHVQMIVSASSRTLSRVGL